MPTAPHTSHPQSQDDIQANVENLLNQMTLAEKIGQMTQVERNSITPNEVVEHAIGSVLSGGGANPTPNTPANWAEMVRNYVEAAQQTRLAIPLLYGVDAVHGHNNVRGAVIFPHNIGLGATRDPALVEKVAQLTAIELSATNVRWTFAPTVAVPQDIRWGRTYEGFSENTDLVTTLGAAQLRGLQNIDGQPALHQSPAVLASVKHFVGDGGTTWGSAQIAPWLHDQAAYSAQSPAVVAPQIDQGITDVDETTLRAVHLPPYLAAIAAGARNIMVSFSSWGGLKMHAQKYLLTDVLKGELGFTGFLVSDWGAIDQIHSDYYSCVVTAINAGMDMIMVPMDYRRFITNLTSAVEAGDIPISRIDDAVRRILTVKLEMGLFAQPLGDESLLAHVGSEAHRAVARQAVRKSLVLLKNDDQTLPLSKATPRILVAGQAADDMGLQCGGWTIEWQGAVGEITPGATLLQAIRHAVADDATVHYLADGHSAAADEVADVGIVVLAENPYAEGVGDRADLSLTADEVALLERVRACCQRLVLVLYSGRPLIITEQLARCDAVVAAWLPGTEGQGIADVLFGDYPFTGQLPYTWPRSMEQIPVSQIEETGAKPLFPFGYGL